MTIILVISFLVLIGACVAFYRRLRVASLEVEDPELPGPFAGLFQDQTNTDHKAPANAIERSKAELIHRAGAGDLEALSNARAFRDPALYDEALNALLDSTSGSQERFLALVRHISSSGELRGNKRLTERLMETWNSDPHVSSAAQIMHIAALSDDAATYERAVELIVSGWESGMLPRLSAEELVELLESQYWILAPEARRGGAAFALKTRLAEVRREMAAPRGRPSPK